MVENTFVLGILTDESVWKIGGVIATGLVTAVSVLWKSHSTRLTRAENNHQECLQQHDKTRIEMGNMKEQLGELRGEVKFANDIRPAIQAIHDKIVQE